MDELFKQYGGPILTVVAIVALIAVITAVIANSKGSFQDMTDQFRQKMNTKGTQAVDQEANTPAEEPAGN